MTDNFDEKVRAWQDAVKKKYPNVANRLKFKNKDNGKHLSAEIDGQDRSYGVFDLAKGEGHVLGEKLDLLKDLIAITESGR